MPANTKREDFANDYNPEVQKIFLSLFVADPDLFAKCRTIVKDEYFDDPFRPLVRFVLQHADTYRAVPSVAMIEAKTGIGLTVMDPKELTPHKEWFCNDLEAFCRYRAMENAILDGVDLLREGRADEVQTRIKDALTIRLMSDLGTDYFDNPEQRLRRMLENTVTVPTGWALLDDKLYGGFARGGLNIFLGNSGAGKSLVLQNLALNWALEGYNGVYFTLELHEDHTALKLDAMLTGRGTRDIVREISDSALLVTLRGKKAGNLRIKKYPEGGTNCNDLRAYLKEYEIVNGHPPDFILIDYLDLLFPNDKRIDPSNLFIKDKFVSEEIRALMHETNTFGATASQLTRGSIEAMGEFDQSHTAGGISKINTADNAIALYAPPSHKERGEFDMIFLKTRASAGVGQRIKLGYDNTCMRITDPALTIGDVDKGASYDDLRRELRETKSIAVTPIPETSDRKLSKLDELMAKRRS
jgi:replicative DNA helicase